MKINYILSNTTAGATTATLKQIIKKAEDDIFGSFVVIAPETKTISIERELLDYSKNGAFANIFVYSFVRLLDRVGNIKKQNIVTKQTCVVILRKIILDNKDNLSCYKKIVKTVGFAEKIYETIQQFKSSGFTPDDIRMIMGQVSASLKIKLEDILLIFDEYEKALGENLIDDCDKLNLLSNFAKTSEFLKNSSVFVVGFDSVTNEMVSVLRELAKETKEITFSCVYFPENRSDKYIQNNELYNKFTKIANSLKYPYVPMLSNTYKKGDFYAVQNYLFANDKKTVDSNGSIQIYEATSKRDEIEFVANQILNEVEKGKRYNEIAVVDNDFETHIQLISEIFDSYGITYFFQKNYDISNHLLTKFIKSAFEMAISHLSAEKVLCFISNQFVNKFDFSLFKNYIDEFGIDHNGFIKDATVDQIKDEEKLVQINNIIQFLREFYSDFKKRLQEASSVKQYIKIIEFLLTKFDVQNELEKVSKIEEQNGFLIESQISQVIFEKCANLNQTLTNFLGESEVNASEFLQIYLSGFSAEQLRLAPISTDCVIVQKDIDNLYGIKDLFLLSAEDGKCPSKIQDSGVILDAEVDEISSYLGENSLEPTVREINQRETYKIYEALIFPTEKLFVSYSTKALSMAATKPAHIIKRLTKLFGDDIKKVSYDRTNFVMPKASEIKFAKDIHNYLYGLSVLDAKTISNEYSKIKKIISNEFKNYLSNFSFDVKNFYIKNASQIYFNNNITSITQLENYFACPYKFFARYGLKLKENKQAKLSSLDVGTIVHKFAEIFVNEIDKFVGKSSEEFNAQLNEIFLRALKELNVVETKSRAIIKFIKDESKRLGNYLYYEQQNSSFKNNKELNEFNFKGNNAVKLKLKDRVINIEGKIDRIDCFGDYIRLIDYKTGNIENDLGSIYYGKKIQLVSYLSAAGKISGKKTAGIFYFPIHSDFVKIDKKIKNNYKMKGFLLNNIDVIKHMDNRLSLENTESEFVPISLANNDAVRKTGELKINTGRTNCFLSNDEFNELKNYTEKLCEIAVNEILSGYIEPSPFTNFSQKFSTECKYCEFLGFCEKQFSRFPNGRRCDTKVDIESFNLEAEDGD